MSQRGGFVRVGVGRLRSGRGVVAGAVVGAVVALAGAGPAAAAQGGAFTVTPTSGPAGTVVNAASGSNPCPPPPGAQNAFGRLALLTGAGQVLAQSQFAVSPSGAWATNLTPSM